MAGHKIPHGCLLALCLALLFNPCVASKSSSAPAQTSQQACQPAHSPTEFYLSQNYPNPARPWTCISFGIPALNAQLPTRIAVYNQNGHFVKMLFSGIKTPGNYSLVWDGLDENGRAAPRGIYIYRIRVGDEFHEVKMMSLRESDPMARP